jgi:hypothetical protein
MMIRKAMVIPFGAATRPAWQGRQRTSDHAMPRKPNPVKQF